MRMKRVFAAGALLLALTPNFAAAQDYYTLPEIREQAKDGWHETYTDKYGRETVVDIDVEVYGGEKAPVLKTKPAWYAVQPEKLDAGAEGRNEHGQIVIWHQNPADFVFGGRSSEKPLIVCHNYYDRLALDTVYGAEYGARNTLRDLTTRLYALLAQQNVEIQLVEDRPLEFSVRCRVDKSTGEVVQPACNMAFFMQKLNDLPVLTHVMRTFDKQSWPEFCAQVYFGMRAADEYVLSVDALEETEKLAEDIPLCAWTTVRSALEQQIEQGHLRQVFDVEFGYALYNDPNGDFSVPSIYDVACYYAVPSWVVHGIYMDNPKQAFVYRGRNDDELNDDIRNTPEYKTLIVNAQTGEMLDPKDKSQRGYGDARYKGFIPWDKVK